MLDMFVFAFVLVTMQVVAGLALVRFMMTDFVMKRYVKFMKKYMNKVMQMEFEDEEEEL